ADIVLASEMDLGMARSGQRHTTRDLAAHLGMGYVFGTEFVELGTGDPYETGLFANVPNHHGLHGNAILSRYPLVDPVLIPLDAGGLWYVTQPKNDGQLRVGGRMALAARVKTAHGPLVVSVAHYESESTPQSRADQTRIWLDGLAAVHGDGAAMIGGDLNTNALVDGTTPLSGLINDPSPAEPAFAEFTARGFDWQRSMASGVTTRAAPGKPVRYPLQVLDWILSRNVAVSDPRIRPALSASGQYLSDHELLTVRVTLQETRKPFTSSLDTT
ncbi:MAG: endonuclease/exonuclease/phosphatase family protein, partial [Marinibacterium sp.]